MSADGDEPLETTDASLPPKLRDLDFQNVTGAEITPPSDLDGYLDDPIMKFGLWVGENEDEAELVGFELDGEQVEGLAAAFERAAEDVREMRGSDS